MYPLTDVGKAVGMIIMLSGVALFALPAGIITAGFIDEFRANRVKKTHRCPNCGEHLNMEEMENHHDNR